MHRAKAYETEIPAYACMVSLDTDRATITRWLERKEAMELAESICAHLSPADAVTVADAILFNARERMGEGR